MKEDHAQFAGSIPAAYDRYLGPVLFQPYAEDLTARLQVPANGSVLELACGTGIVTRELRNRLPATVTLIATDLNEPMFQHAAQVRRKRNGGMAAGRRVQPPVWRGIFDAVVCQFGIMFVPDKRLAAREARRVLKPGGRFLFNVWDAIEHNELCRIAHDTIAGYFDKDPPTFYQVPFGYHDHAEIRRVLTEAGFQEVRIDVVEKMSGASRAEDTAIGLVQGNPVSAAIAERDPALLPVITDAIAAALKNRFGDADFRAPLRAIVVQAGS
jgi:ubiquinone/menaquinone biosynthesis C-methylase UbiE